MTTRTAEHRTEAAWLAGLPIPALRSLREVVAEDRAESDDCERLTPGCSIDHTAEAQRDRTADSPCET